MSYFPASYSSTTNTVRPASYINGYHPAIEPPLHTDTRPRQFGRPSSASEDILTSGAAVPPGPVEPNTLPVITVRAAASNELPDSRLALFESEAFKANLTRAMVGDSVAVKYLADIYNEGNGHQQSNARADHWMHRAATQGHAGSQLLLGLLHLRGSGVEQNDAEMVHWFQKAAGQGHPGAQWKLGCLYLVGRGVKRNEAEAIQWIQKAAWQGHADAQMMLGCQYTAGRGVKQDHGSAFKWYQQAAVQGHARAQSLVGWIYLMGRGVPQDDESAFKWTQQAAAQGDAGAQAGLGGLYFQGRGVKKDDRQAAYWALLSGLSADGLTQSCAATLPVELVKYLPQLINASPEWRRLQTMQIDLTELNDDAARYLAQLIKENQTLKILKLSNKVISPGFANALAEALRFNSTLHELQLEHTASTETARADIARALDSNKNITVLKEEVKDNPAQQTEEMPFEVIALIEQATIVADQKAGEANRTLEQTRESINEMRLAFARNLITGPH